MIKAVDVATEDAISKKLADGVNLYFAERAVFQELSLTRDVVGDIRKNGADLLITIDLAGFDRITLTDGIAYNLLDCKQVHLLLHGQLKNEGCLSKLLSIAMFFGCKNEEYAADLWEKYPDIPWLRVLNEWRKGETQEELRTEVAAIGELLEEVFRECHLG